MRTYFKSCVFSIPALLLLLGPTSGFAADQQPSDSKTSPVMRINGKTIGADALTSFSSRVEQYENGYPPEGLTLVNEYILTELYDKIPTTATLPATAEPAGGNSLNSLAARTLLKRELRDTLSKEAKVPREEMQAWYDKNYHTYEQPEKVHAWHLFMETSEDNPSSSPQKVRQRLQELKGQIDAGTSFSVAAAENSEAASGKKGGEIGYISPRQPIGPLQKPMNPELEDVFFKLPVNKVSDVVETKYGMHLLYVTDKQSTATPTLDDLVTSGILPGALAQARVTSGLQELVKETITKHNGKALPGYEDHQPVTSATVAYVMGGKNTTVGDLTNIFGPRFEQFLETQKQNPEGLRRLMQQGLEEDALVVAAIDKGLAEKPETRNALQFFRQRELSRNRVKAISDAETTVTESDIAQRYHELMDQLRQPEAEGYVVMVEAAPSTGTAEDARAREAAIKLADKIAEHMKTADFAEMEKQISNDGNPLTTITLVPRHAIGASTETQVRIFDQVLPTVDGPDGVGSPSPVGRSVAIVRSTGRYPGEPLPLAEVHDRIASLLKNEKESKEQQKLVDRLVQAGLVEFLPGAEEFGVIDAAATKTSATQQASGETTSPAAAK